jgi:hypothetical protein
MRRQATRTPEETERGDLTQYVVCNNGGRLLDLGGVDDGDAGGHIAEPLFRAGGGDGDRFQNGGWRQDDIELGGSVQQLPFLGKTAGADDNGRLPFWRFVDRKPAVRARDGLLLGA